MIRIRRQGQSQGFEELSLADFEEGARRGDITPQHEVCFPAVTGENFVKARDLELFRSLYAAGPIAFSRYFHLARVPWLTMTLIAILVGVYLFWQGNDETPGAMDSPQRLLALGAKSRTLIVELGDWWRLLSANFLHVSPLHLGVNAVFLFNLGGPTEAIFRRIDYAIVVVVSCLGTTALSTLANPTVSCGASGLVFGVWGAAAVFGIRHRDILPDRYRRYFIFSVVPYSLVALYLGLATAGIDNWGHLGGLAAGCTVAAFLPARLLEPSDPHAGGKLLGLSMLALLLALGGLMPLAVGDLGSKRQTAPFGMKASVPQRWPLAREQRHWGSETLVFENGAGVAIAVESRQGKRYHTQPESIREFIGNDLARQLEDVSGLRVSEPRLVFIGHDGRVEAQHIHTEVVTADTITSADFYVVTTGVFRHILLLRAPSWLVPSYRPLFAKVLASVQLVPPRSLVNAQTAVQDSASANNLARLALEQGRNGDLNGARKTAASLTSTVDDGGGDHGEPPPSIAGLRAATLSQILWQARNHNNEACALGDQALAQLPATAELLLMQRQVHGDCAQHDQAEQIGADGQRLFPGDHRFSTPVMK